MVKFAHIADCHLGGWRQEELSSLNFSYFEKVIDEVLEKKVDFILIAGDLFDSAYPSIDILKKTFGVFKKIKKNNIPVYLIAGSHDFSASGKTFLDVLEYAGFCKNVFSFENLEDGTIKLNPSYYKDIAIYGYPGKKSSMEVEDLKKVSFEYVKPFTIFMVHSTLKDVVGDLPVEYLDKEKLPLADYYAFGHIHRRYFEEFKGSYFAYPGPTFPMNFQELKDLASGSYRIVEYNEGKLNQEIFYVREKEVVFIELEISDAFSATQEIISKMDQANLNDKIVLLKLKGILTSGKTGDINFYEIEEFAKKKNCYSFLRNMSSLKIRESSYGKAILEGESVGEVEDRILKEYKKEYPDELNKYLLTLMSLFSMDKKEDEKTANFEERLISEIKSALEISGVF